MLMSLNTERRSSFMKWLCAFLKGTKPEPNRHQPLVTAGEENTLWQEPVRPKVLGNPTPLFRPSLTTLSIFFKWFFQLCAFTTHIQFHLHKLYHLGTQLIGTFWIYYLQEDPPRYDNEELYRALAQSLAEDVKPPKGTKKIHMCM
jgi:hypothetical protein